MGDTCTLSGFPCFPTDRTSHADLDHSCVLPPKSLEMRNGLVYSSARTHYHRLGTLQRAHALFHQTLEAKVKASIDLPPGRDLSPSSQVEVLSEFSLS